jgi:hypothetical protein
MTTFPQAATVPHRWPADRPANFADAIFASALACAACQSGTGGGPNDRPIEKSVNQKIG